MAVVFSDEIEAILRAGPPKIDWDAISAQLKADFLAGPNVASAMKLDGDGGEGLQEDTRCGRLFAPLVELRPEGSDSSVDVCPVWACLHARETMADLRVDRPVVVASAGSVAGLKGLNAPWVTFSAASVRELNSMGIDCVLTTRRAVHKRLDGAVVYRGAGDTDDVLAAGITNLLFSLTGDVTYVTAFANDDSELAEGFMHMFSNGGRVCGYASRAATCGLCRGTGLVIGDLYGASSDVENALPYCVCGAGERREAKDDEDAEYDQGAFIMGRYDGGRSDFDDNTSRWDDDDAVFERGDCSEPVGPSVPAVDVAVAPLSGEISLAAAVGGPPISIPPSSEGAGIEERHERGWCYMDMLRSTMFDEAVEELDEWPTVERLLLAPSRFFDLVAMHSLAFEVWDNSRALLPGLPQGQLLHVKPLAAAGGRRIFLFEALRWVCKDSGMDYGEDTLAHALFVDHDTYRVEPGVALHNKVGGGATCGSPAAGVSSRVSPSSSVEPGSGKVVPVVAYTQGYDSSGNVVACPSTRMVTESSLRGVKGRCEICGFLVNQEGHESRCDPGGHLAGYGGFVAPAWLGDAAHALDVRAVLLDEDLEPEGRHLDHNRLTSAVDQARYYRSLPSPPVSPVGRSGSEYSDHTVASMFEAHYRDAFRNSYLMSTFGRSAAEVDRLIGAVLLPVDGSPGSTPGGVAGGSGLGVWAVVMPPGHGKTYRHGAGRLVEADSVCLPEHEEELVDLMDGARAGLRPWSEFVAAWASRLRARARAGTVVMVPTVDVAVAAGFKLVGAFLLDELAWQVNLEGRSVVQVERARECYNSVSCSGVVTYRCASNEELTEALALCVRFLG